MKKTLLLIGFILQFLTINAIQKDSYQRKTQPVFIAPKYEKLSFYNINEVPNPKKNGANGFISDPNGIILNGEKFKLNKKLWRIENNTTVQIAIVVLPSIGQEIPKDFAVKLFEEWGIGQSDKDNGLLILTVMDQRRTEFEVGYGLEPILTDLVCHRIGTDEIVPYFKKGEFGKGFIAATNRIEEIVNNPDIINDIYSQNISYNESENLPLLPILLVYLLLSGLLTLRTYGKIKTIDKSKEDYYDKHNDLDSLDNNWGCLVSIAAVFFPIYGVYITILKKNKLKKYRYARRYSRVNGKLLILQNEWAENHFLKEAQILEEKLKSTEYDVWVTEDHSDVLILEYQGSSRAYSDCKKCNYKTFGRHNTRIIKNATYTSSGKKEEIYLCKNCHYSESEIIYIPKLVKSSSSSSSSSSWSSSSSSSSSSSWGGGSSGGGGAGVSW